MAEKLDFVAIGDITTDTFIELKDATVNCEINRDTCMLCMRFGDKIPYESVKTIPAVGNSPNASVSAARLGLSSALVSNLGNDEYGREDIEALKQNGVITDYVVVHEDIPSNHHFVLRYEEERTILIKHQEYPYKLPDFKAPPTWMYLSSLGENSIDFHHEIAQFLTKNPEVKLAFQPGTFQIRLGYEALKDLYNVTELFFCNKEEAKRILKTQQDTMMELLQGIKRLGPNIAIITDGPKGAYAFDGSEAWKMPMYPDPKPPTDRTGAGDSFSSTFTAAIALGNDIPTALSWGPVNSMSVVQYIGAQEGLLPQEKLEELLKNAPADYKPEKIS